LNSLIGEPKLVEIQTGQTNLRLLSRPRGWYERTRRLET
jgi:hypothetical protein